MSCVQRPSGMVQVFRIEARALLPHLFARRGAMQGELEPSLLASAAPGEVSEKQLTPLFVDTCVCRQYLRLIGAKRELTQRRLTLHRNDAKAETMPAPKPSKANQTTNPSASLKVEQESSAKHSVPKGKTSTVTKEAVRSNAERHRAAMIRLANR